MTSFGAGWLALAIGTVMAGNNTVIGVDSTIETDSGVPGVGLYHMYNASVNSSTVLAGGPTSPPLASAGISNALFAKHTSAPYPPFNSFSGAFTPTQSSPSASYTELRFRYLRSAATQFVLAPTMSFYTSIAVGIGTAGTSFSSGIEHSNTATLDPSTPASAGGPISFNPITSSPVTGSPTKKPTTSQPSASPTGSPSHSHPSLSPVRKPSNSPSSSRPSNSPVRTPSQAPTLPGASRTPSHSPTVSKPSLSPSTSPTRSPTSIAPSISPSNRPSKRPSLKPTGFPTASPSRLPTSARPTSNPSNRPIPPPTPKPTSSNVTSNGSFAIDNGGGPILMLSYSSTLVASDILLTLTVAVNDDCWVGIGLGSQMVGALAVIGMGQGLQLSSGHPPVGVFAMNGKDESAVICASQPLSAYGISAASFAYINGWSTLALSINTSASPAQLQFMTASASALGITMQLAQGESGFTTFYRHVFYGFAKVNMYPVASSADSGGATPPPFTSPLREAGVSLTLHIVFMLAAFVLLFPTGALVAMSRWPKNKWLQMHVFIQLACSALAVAGASLGALNRQGRGLSMVASTHASLGVAILVLLMAHVVLAIASRWMTSRAHEWWTRAHKVVALFVLVAGPTNCYLGTQRFTLAQGKATSAMLGNPISNASFVVVITAMCFASIGVSVVAVAVRLVSSRRDFTPQPIKVASVATAAFDYAAKDPKDLRVVAGEKLTVQVKFDDGWSRVINARGEMGLVPSAYLNMVE